MYHRIIVTLVVLLIAASVARADVRDWANRVLADDEQPQWKHAMAEKVLAGLCGTLKMLPTQYSDSNALDPGTGGGPFGCTWTDPNGRRRQAVKLRYGHVAADLRYHPTGTVLYADEPFCHTWIVVDCGSGVRGRNRVDVYCPDLPTWQHYRSSVRQSIRVHVLGRISRQQLMDSYPGNPVR